MRELVAFIVASNYELVVRAEAEQKREGEPDQNLLHHHARTEVGKI